MRVQSVKSLETLWRQLHCRGTNDGIFWWWGVAQVWWRVYFGLQTFQLLLMLHKKERTQLDFAEARWSWEGWQFKKIICELSKLREQSYNKRGTSWYHWFSHFFRVNCILTSLIYKKQHLKWRNVNMREGLNHKVWIQIRFKNLSKFQEQSERLVPVYTVGVLNLQIQK